MSTTSVRTEVQVEELTLEAGQRAFDARCRELLGMSGEEFLARLRRGEPWNDAEEPAVSELALLVPFAE